MEEFNRNGCKFTLDDVCRKLKISKKTIYQYFDSKEKILEEILRESFDDVHQKQTLIFQDDHGDTRDKLERILTSESKYERRIAVERVAEFEQYYPQLHRLLLDKYATEWDYVMQLLERGMAEGIFRPINPALVQRLLQEGMQTLHRGGFLARSGLSYWEAIRQMVSIILDGISVRKNEGEE